MMGPMTPPSAPPTRALAAEIDPVRFEVIRNGLARHHRGDGATLRRAAYSTNIKTRGDFSCAFFDRELRTIAQAFAQPAHLGSLAHLVPRAIRAYGPERLQPGDGILINDPYQGGVHLNDITLITPVFHEGELLGYVANIAHHVDVGGGAPGSIGVSSEIYQEGLIIPPRALRQGRPDRPRHLRDDPRQLPRHARDLRRLPRADRRQSPRRPAASPALVDAARRGHASRSISRSCCATPSAARAPPSPSSPTARSAPRCSWTATASPTSR